MDIYYFGWNERCFNCGRVIVTTHHMENDKPECMKCYCDRIIRSQ